MEQKEERRKEMWDTEEEREGWGKKRRSRKFCSTVRILIKESWTLLFGIWVLYFHRMFNTTFQVVGVDEPLSLRFQNEWSCDLGYLGK